MVDRGDQLTTAARSMTPVRTDDWPVQATDKIVQVVDTVRSKTTGPAITAARAVVYGLFAAILGIAMAVLGAIITVRVLDAYLPSSIFGETHTWAAHLIIGTLFSLAALVLWLKGRPRSTGSE